MIDTRYTYSYGYSCRTNAEIALNEMLAGDEVSLGEWPRIEPYYAKARAQTNTGKTTVRLYAITLERGAA